MNKFLYFILAQSGKKRMGFNQLKVFAVHQRSVIVRAFRNVHKDAPFNIVQVYYITIFCKCNGLRLKKHITI